MSKPNWKDKIRRTPTHEAIESLMETAPTVVAKADERAPAGDARVIQTMETNVVASSTVQHVDVNVNIARPKRIKFEEQYTRQTFYIHNDILEKLQIAAGDEKGEKTRIINEALKRYLKRQ